MNPRHRSLAAAPVGAVLLRRAMTSPPDSPRFYRSTLALALWWFAAGAALEPRPAGDPAERRDHPPAEPVLFGLGLFVVFYGLAAVVGQVPVLRRALVHVLRFATTGSAFHTTAVALLTGAAEEFYFRGALYRAYKDSQPVAVTTAVYTAIAVPTMNAPLVAASAVMGTVFADQRRKSGGLQAPLVTHMVWSLLVARLLPRLFDELR